MNEPLRSLLVEDVERDALLVLEALRWEGYEPSSLRVQTVAEMEAALTKQEWDIILCDYALPGFDAMAALQLVKQMELEVPVIIVSGTVGEEKAVSAIKAGASDYLMKDRLTRLGAAVRQNLEQAKLRKEQKRVAQDLAKEQALFNSLFNTIPDHIYFKDLTSRFVRVNEAFARSFGLPSTDDVVGKTDSDYFTEKHALQAYADEQRIMTTGEPIVGFEEMETWPDGHCTWVSSTKVPLRDPQGKVIGLIGVSRDVTEQKQLEEQLRQAQKMEAIGLLAGGVAHDFNNLLTVIKGYIGLLRMKGLISPDMISSIQQIDQATNRASNLTRQLLMFSRQQEMEQTEYNLTGLVQNMVKMLRRLLSENIALTVECEKRPLTIRADQGMIEQVLLNLVVNARDAMPKGGTLLIATQHVEVDEAGVKNNPHARAGSFVCLTVTDSGTGIPANILPRIFDPFFTTKAVGHGTGLGLATVYSIMQQHAGWISVESTEGVGTTFRTYFPLIKSATMSLNADKAIAALPGGHEGVLLVEDEASVRIIAEAVLAGLGYRVYSAANGPAALEIWQAHRDNIELLLTDLIMPDGVTGRELAVRLREENPQLPIIYMSGYSREVSAGYPLTEGINYLSKPFEPTGLAKIVRESIDRGASRSPFTRPPHVKR